MKLRSRAAANLVRGLGGSLPLAVLPALLARQLAVEPFAVWLIIVQLATYISYLEFGVQTALVRSTAAAYARGDRDDAGATISAGLGLLLMAAAAAAVMLAAIVAVLPGVFSVPTDLVPDARLALLIMGSCAALALPGTGVHGALIGADRYWASAIIVAATRLSSVVATVVAAQHGASLPALAACLGAGSLLSTVGAHAAAALYRLPVHYRRVARAEYRRVGSVVLTLAIGNLAMLVISGVDILVVGLVDFANVAAYGLASSLVLLFAAGYSLIGTALLPVFAALEARGEPAESNHLLERTSVIGSAALGAGLVLLMLVREVVLVRWAGSYADDAMFVFVVLAIAQAIRLSLIPTGNYLVAGPDHRLARRPVTVEAVANLTASVVLGVLYGYRGVAVGTLVGTLPPLAVAWWIFGRRGIVGADRRRLATRAFAVPAVVAAIAVLAVARVDAWFVQVGAALVALVVLGTIALREVAHRPTPG